MNIGTRSLLFGVHQVFIHPWFVAYAWWKLYGFPWDPRLWVCFIVHDWGYWGCPNMDGPEGEEHPELGACIVAYFFCFEPTGYWYRFMRYHSRFLAKKDGMPYSRLCVADKYSIVVTPRWLYFILARLSGELWEYLEHARTGKYTHMNIGTLDPKLWHSDMCDYLRKWVEEHKDLKEDTWTGVKH